MSTDNAEVTSENIVSVRKTLELLPDGDLKKALQELVDKYEKRQKDQAAHDAIVGVVMTQVRTALKEVRPKDLTLELIWNASGELTIKERAGSNAGGNRDSIKNYELVVNGKTYKGHGFRELAFAIDATNKTKKNFNARAWLENKKYEYKEV